MYPDAIPPKEDRAQMKFDWLSERGCYYCGENDPHNLERSGLTAPNCMREPSTKLVAMCSDCLEAGERDSYPLKVAVDKMLRSATTDRGDEPVSGVTLYECGTNRLIHESTEPLPDSYPEDHIKTHQVEAFCECGDGIETTIKLGEVVNTNSDHQIAFSKTVGADGRIVVPQEHRKALTIEGREALIECQAQKTTDPDDEGSNPQIRFSKKVDADGLLVVPQNYRDALTGEGDESLVEFNSQKITYLDIEESGS